MSVFFPIWEERILEWDPRLVFLSRHNTPQPNSGKVFEKRVFTPLQSFPLCFTSTKLAVRVYLGGGFGGKERVYFNILVI